MDRLYEECRDHDLVLVPDPPMASALTRRLDEARFGTFATTPRRLAAGRRETAEDRSAFLEAIQRTDLDWKAAAHAIGNVLQSWEHQADPEAILGYEGFGTPAIEAVLECLSEIETTSSKLQDYEIGPEPDVAVIGIEEFSPLERSILPPDYDRVDALTDDAFELPPFRIFDSAASIVDTILETVTPENADRLAIVLDGASDYAPLVEAALEAEGIPYYGGPGFVDHPDHRAFLSLLRTAHSGSDVRVRDVRPVLQRVGIDPGIAHDEKRIDTVDLPELEWLSEVTAALGDCTFNAALRVFEHEAGTRLRDFRDELDRLGLLEASVAPEAVNRLEFYLHTYTVPVDRENEGVLLADATAAATVDRPGVFYLGMDRNWTHATPRRPWVDRDAEFTKHIHEFQRLLQNGVTQYYLVEDERGGRAVTPCLYFEELLPGEVDRFSDLESQRYARSPWPASTGFEREPLGIPPDRVETVSQSTLKRVVNCPRDQLFASLVDGPERIYLRYGTLFHDFAEVYAEHPTSIDDETLDAVVEFMLEQTRPFASDVEAATNRTYFRIGVETIAEFLDENPPVGAHFVAPGDSWGSNRVAEHLGLSVDAPHAEWWFQDADLGVNGVVDLVHSPTRFVDYKSGNKKSERKVVARCALDPPHDVPDFQALQYLTYLRSEQPDETLSFTFVYLREILDDAVTGTADLDEALTTVRYRPVTFDTYIERRSTYEALCEEGYRACRRTCSGLSYETYAEVVAAHEFPDTDDSDELRTSPFGQALRTRAIDAVGDYAYVDKGCAQALRYLRGIRDSTFFREDLDAFEAFVQDRIADLNRYRTGKDRHPVDGLDGEPNWDRVDHRDMILEGDD